MEKRLHGDTVRRLQRQGFAMLARLISNLTSQVIHLVLPPKVRRLQTSGDGRVDSVALRHLLAIGAALRNESSMGCEGW
ncbi:hypothetical protein AAY473_015299 [Plecturocebus cupreus]